jgi:hypothetical protein
MDSHITNQIKELPHLPASTPNGLLYRTKRDGGLDIPKLEILSSSTELKHGIKLLNTTDPAMQAFLTTTKPERLQKLAKSIRLQWPILNVKHVDTYKKCQKHEERRQWSQLPSKGNAVRSFGEHKYGIA